MEDTLEDAVPRYSFGDVVVDGEARRVTRNGELLSIPERHLGVLLELLARREAIVSKDALIEAVWQDVAVTDNSLEQAVSALRRLLGAGPDGQPYIQTVPRQGYRFAGSVTTVAARVGDSVLEELLAPHRAWVEGRAALETLERDQIVRARRVFEGVLEHTADHAPAHIGLANACIMHFEMTRADERPDVAALEVATQHSREACRLAPDYGEAWATLGFVLDRTGRSIDALAASRRAVSLEPDNWRHHFRLAYVGWGEERLRAAHRTLALLPGFPLAHWLIATVHVARHALAEADRQLALGITSLSSQSGGTSRFSAVALHGCVVSSASPAAMKRRRSKRSSASLRRKATDIFTGASVVRTHGTQSAHCACNRAIVTPRPPHFVRRWLASQGTHWPGSGSPLSQQPMLRRCRLRTRRQLMEHSDTPSHSRVPASTPTPQNR